MGYLNNTGLSHFWDKLKQFFVKKSEVENAGISNISYTTVLASTTVTTALATGYRYPSAVLSSSVPNDFSQAYLYRITINNTEKRMPCVLWFRQNNAGTGIQPIEFIGNPSYMLAEDVTSYFGHGDVDTTCGFCISARDIANDGARKLMLFTPTAGSYTVKIELENRDVTKFPPDLTFDNYNNPISEVINRNNINSLSVGPNYMKHKTGTTSVGAGNINSGITSTSVGVLNEASGQLSVAVGTQNKATSIYSTAIGNSNESTGAAASAFGYRTAASGQFATTNGNRTIANHKSQFVFGEFNEPDPSAAAATARGRYVEIVGNGTSPDSADRSNARTLDWSGNERLAGSLTLGAGGANEKTITPEQLANTMQGACEYILGTQTASTNAFKGVTHDTALYNGKHIFYKLPYAGTNSSATLELTYPDNTTTGALPVYYTSGSRLTTHYGANNVIGMTYVAADNAWYCDADRDTDSYAYALRAYYNIYKTYTNLYRYQVCFTKDNEYILPANAVDNNTGTSKQLTTEEFDPFGEIYWYWTTTTISAGSVPTGSNLVYNYWLVDLRYSFNAGQTLTAKKDVYIVCVPQKNGKVKLANPAITQELPTTEDGLVYIRFGKAYDTYRVEMGINKPVYYYANGEIREWTNSPTDAKLAEYNTDEDVFQIRHAKAEKPSYNSEVVRKITGGTLAWNQIYTHSGDRSGSSQGVTITDNGDGSFTLNGTATANGSLALNSTYEIPLPKMHVFYVCGYKAGTGGTNNYLGFAGLQTDKGVGGLWKNTTNYDALGMRVDFSSGTVYDNVIIKPQCFDLTQTFGSTIADRIYALEQATAGAGVAWFRRYFNRDYYEPAQTLANTYFDQYETTGFNQYDGVPTIGKFWNNGTLSSGMGNTLAATENKVRCIPNATYCVSFPNAVKTHNRVYATLFDADGIFLRTVYSDVATASKYVFTTDSDCHKFAISFYTDSSTFANGDFNSFCINLSDESRNGQYEPYRHSRITFFDNPVLLRGIPYLDENDNLRFNGDTLEAPRKLTRRYTVVDLGTLNWTYNASQGRFLANITGAKVPPDMSTKANLVCAKYETVSTSATMDSDKDKVIGLSQYMTLGIKDTSAGTDAAAFKTAMSGVMLVYELATPTEEEFTPIDGPLVSDPLGLEIISKSDWDDTPTLAQMDILYANEVRANVEMIATNKVVAMRRAITTKRGMPAASSIDLNTFCNYGEYDISLSTVSNAPPDVTGIKLIVQSTVADTETTGGLHPKDTIQIFIGSDTSGIVKIFTRLYLRTSQNIKYWSSWSSSGPAPILELSNCSWQGDGVQASISNMSVYDVDGMDILAIKVPCVEGGDYEDDAFICIKAYDSILNNDRLIFTSVPNSDGRYLQLTLESNNTGIIVSGEILNIHDVIVYNITFDSHGEANQPISFNSALALLLSGKMIVLKAGSIYYYPAYNVSSNADNIRFATTLDDSGYWNDCTWSSSTGKISIEEYDLMGMVYDGYGERFIPSGGTTGQFLVKNSNTNYDVGWVTVPNANGVSF